jgi:hypothetical protein
MDALEPPRDACAGVTIDPGCPVIYHVKRKGTNRRKRGVRAARSRVSYRHRQQADAARALLAQTALAIKVAPVAYQSPALSFQKTFRQTVRYQHASEIRADLQRVIFSRLRRAPSKSERLLFRNWYAAAEDGPPYNVFPTPVSKSR